MNAASPDRSSRDQMETLIRGWRSASLPEVRMRARALAMISWTERLPTHVYDAWLQMNAVLVVARCSYSERAPR